MEKDSDKMYIRKVLFISRLALVLVLLFVVVRTVLLPRPQEASLAPASALGRDRIRANEANGPPDLSFENYIEIVEKNPFGTSGRTRSSAKSSTIANAVGLGQSVSEQLGLELVGTVSGNPAVARAIIKNLKTGVLEMYRIGQTVADARPAPRRGGARIERIDTDTVILLHNGQRKMLELSTAQFGNYSGNNTQATSTKNINESSYAARADLSSKKVRTDVQPAIGSVEAILNEAVIEPYVVNGQMEGLRITGLENIDMAKDLGLKNGDIICAVNGHQMTSKQTAYQIFKKARSQEAISLELLRDNKTKKLSFDLR